MKDLTVAQLAKYLDHVNNDTTPLEVYCRKGVEYGVKCCAVNMQNAGYVKNLLKGTDLLVSGAVAFPGGHSTIEAKLLDVQYVIKSGAEEMDYVTNRFMVKQHNWDYITEEMTRIAELCRQNGVVDKVIIECCELTQEEKIKMCEIAKIAKPGFVKTSTGTSYGGATTEDVRLIRSIVGDVCQVKAAGGIRNYYTVLAMIEAGADRMGTSAAIKILDGYKAYLDSKK